MWPMVGRGSTAWHRKGEAMNRKQGPKLGRSKREHLTPDEGKYAPVRPTRHVLAKGNPPDAAALLHGLQVHQVELEVQNEELRRTQQRLEEAVAKYEDRYDWCPVGHVSLDGRGTIREINLTAANFLGLDRSRLIGSAFASYVHEPDRRSFRNHVRTCRRKRSAPLYEIRLKAKGGALLPVEVGSILVRDVQTGSTWSRMAIADIRDRNHLEEALSVSLAKYQAIFNSFPLGISISDKSGKIVESNEEGARLLGLPKDSQLRGQIDGRAWRAVRADGSPMPTQEFASVVALKENRAAHNVGVGIFRGDRDISWIDMTAAPIPLEGGGVAIAYWDVSERLGMEKALRENRRRYQEAESIAHFGHWARDYVHGTAIWSEGLYRIFGREEGSFVPTWENFVSAVHPDDRETVCAKVKAALANRGVLDIEYRIVRPDGTVRTVQTIARLSADSSGRASGLIGTVHDITERKQAEEALRASETRIRLLAGVLENASQPFAIGTQEGRLGAFNAAFCELVGYTEQELQERNWKSDLTPPEYRALEEKLGKEMRRTGQAVRYEKEYLRKDGSRVPVELLVRQIHQESGAPGSYCAFVTDLTQRKRAQLYRELTVTVLQLLNRAGPRLDTIKHILLAIKESMGVEAVGIRLQEGDDFPYYKTNGFPHDFVKKERSLCACDPDGQIVRDKQGDAVLECMCGNVLRGRIDPSQPFFTNGGSFWTNSTTALLASTAEADRQGRTRNRCNRQGYESVALVPLKSNGSIIGLLQLNDRRKGCFSPDMIRFLEGIGASIGVALERNRSEEALRHSEVRYRSLFENMIEGLAHCRMIYRGGKGVDFVYLDLNRAFESITGLRNIVGKRVTEVIPGICKSNPELFEVYGRVASTGRPERFETHVDALGTWFDVSVFSPQQNHFVAVFDNITERKRAEHARRESDDRLRLAAEAARFGTYAYDFVNDIGHWSPEFKALMGVKPDEKLPLDADKLFLGLHPDDRPAFLAAMKAANGPRGSGLLQLDYRILLPDGSVRWLQVRGLTFFAGDGQARRPVRATGIVLDITDRKRTEEALRHSQAVLAEAQRIANVGSWEWDVQSGSLAWSDQLYRMFGEEPGNLVLTHDWFLSHVHPDDRQRVTEALQDALARRKPFSVEFRAVTRAGKTLVLQSQGEVTFDKSGQPVRMVGSGLDITERQRLQAQLLQAQKMEAIGRLAGGVAHDFRNQLTVIKGFGEMIRRRSLVIGEGRDKLDEILKAADRSTLLAGQLLAFSRQEMLQPQVVDLVDVVADISKALPRLIGEDVRLRILASPRACPVKIDPGQFQQALFNLAANARDAMPGGGELTIQTAIAGREDRRILRDSDRQATACAVVTVTDTGCGMDAATQSKLFEPFFTTKPVGQGTGLGLPMVYGFVNQSGGTILVESSPGKGSTFRLYFPLVRQPVTPAKVRAEAAAASGGTETILLVEDEAAVRTLLAESLREGGYTVLEAGGSQEALAIAQQRAGAVDAMVADVVMPGGSGVDLAEKVRSAWPSVQVLFMSGYADGELSQRGVELFQGRILTKPCGHAELLKAVRQLLDAGRVPGRG
jgi:PAS domain S-box-containing protein